VVALLTDRFATANIAHPSSNSNDTLRHDELVELFRSLAFIVRSTFGKVVTDLEDFAYLTAKFWPRWKAVREQSNREWPRGDGTASHCAVVLTKIATAIVRLQLRLRLPMSLAFQSRSSPNSLPNSTRYSSLEQP
jgi:hypothetical protein